MYDFPKYKDIEEQLRAMGLYECIFHTKVRCCGAMLGHLIFNADKLGFCCASSSGFNKKLPLFPYLKTAEETILNFLKNKEIMINELTTRKQMTVAKPCITCRKLRNKNHLFGLTKIKSINISCYPSICQAKCIFCGIHKSSHNTYEKAKHSNYPKVIAEILTYLKANGYINDDCSFIVAPAEITIMPHKDLLLEAISGYKAEFLTNGFIFNSKIANSMKDNGSFIKVSVDSGTRETFQLIKGFDIYEKLLSNLLKYRKYGYISIKYIVIPGVNDSDANFNGILNLLDTLKLNEMMISYEYGMPIRSCFYSITRLVKKLQKKEKNFRFYPYYTEKQIQDFINIYYSNSHEEHMIDCEQKINMYEKLFYQEYKNDYGSYRKFVYKTELIDLLKLFNKETRFCLLNGEKNKEILSAFNELSLDLILVNSSLEEIYEEQKDRIDVFVTRNKGNFNNLQSFLMSKGKEKALLDIEKYMYSVEPKQVFLENNILEKYYQ